MSEIHDGFANTKGKLSQIIVAAREEQGMSQEDVAMKMGVPVARVMEIEQLLRDVRMEDLHAYARAIGCELKVSMREP